MWKAIKEVFSDIIHLPGDAWYDRPPGARLKREFAAMDKWRADRSDKKLYLLSLVA